MKAMMEFQREILCLCELAQQSVEDIAQLHAQLMAQVVSLDGNIGVVRIFQQSPLAGQQNGMNLHNSICI